MVQPTFEVFFTAFVSSDAAFGEVWRWWSVVVVTVDLYGSTYMYDSSR